MMAKACAVFHQRLVQDQRKTRLISWQYFTKRLTRQCHHLCSSDYESFFYLIYCTRGYFFLKIVFTFSLVFPLAEFEVLLVELARGPDRVRGDTSGGCTLLRILEQRRRQWVSSARPSTCRWQVRAATMRSSS